MLSVFIVCTGDSVGDREFLFVFKKSAPLFFMEFQLFSQIQSLDVHIFCILVKVWNRKIRDKMFLVITEMLTRVPCGIFSLTLIHDRIEA